MKPKQPPKRYAPGELDGTRSNLGSLSGEEAALAAERMWHALRGTGRVPNPAIGIIQFHKTWGPDKVLKTAAASMDYASVHDVHGMVLYNVQSGEFLPGDFQG